MNDFNIQDGIFISYQGREESFAVPEGIHTIAEDAFKACISLKKIVLPHSLRRIMPRAFKGCRNLCEFEIPEGVSYIGDYAFHRCHSLQSIRLPASVEELGSCVFLYCDSLREVHIPGVRRLGNQAFLNDTLLEKLEISRDLEEECIRDVFTSCGRICEVSFADGECFLVPNLVEAASGELSLPTLIQKIAADVLTMFELDGHCLVRFLTNLRHVEIPEGITQIGKSCFFDRRGIISITLPASLREIQSRAFRNCISLERVVFRTEEIIVHEDAFKNCTSLKQILLPAKTETVAFRGETAPSDAKSLPSDKEAMPLDGKTASSNGNFLPSDKEAMPSDGKAASSNGKSSPSAENPLPSYREFSLQGLSALSQQGVPVLVQTICGQVLENFRLCGTILLKYLGNESRVIVPEGVTAIAEGAFEGKESIDRLILPDSVREIGNNAFKGCLLLQTIKLPSLLQRIGGGAFENCVKLIRLSLPDSVEKIEKRTFCRCRSLVEIHFGTNLSEIGEEAFYGCSALGAVEFPDTLTCVGAMAFYRCGALKNLLLPKNVDQIGNLAFAQSGVQEVKISGSGTNFGIDIFSNCTHLTTLVLEEGVRHISDKLAFGCTVLNKVILPESLESVGRNAFDKTQFLEIWSRELRDASSLPDKIFWDGSGLEGDVRLSEQTKIIAGGAFYGNTKITSVRIPDSVRTIGKAAFKGCNSLSQVRWPNGVSIAQDEVFSGCTALKNLENAPSWQFIGNRAFFGCEVLPSLSLETVESIGNEAFSGCCLLAKSPVTNVRFIGERAFEDTPYLKDQERNEILSRDFPNGTDSSMQATTFSLPDENYQNGTGLPLVNTQIPKAKTIGSIVIAGNILPGSVTVPEGTTSISPFAFFNNKEITKLILPKSLLYIGEGAFLGCQNLEEVIFPETDCKVEARAFEKCTKIKQITIHAGVLHKAAFAYCTSLECVSISHLSVSGEGELLPALLPFTTSHLSVSEEGELLPAPFSSNTSYLPVLEEGLFEGCINLKEVIFDFPEAIHEIKPSCFRGCKQLNRIDLRNVQKIASYAFENCDSLQTITLSEDTFLDAHAFQDCSSLTEIHILGNPAKLQMREYAFSGCTALKRVIAGDNVWEFSCYHDVYSSAFPQAVRMIFYSAFSCFDVEKETILCGYHGCGRRVNIPEGIRRIEAEVFYDVLMLEEIQIPESVEYIGARAFHKTAWLDRQRQLSPMVMVNHMLVDASCCAGEVTVPADIRMVCGWAFANGLDIKKIRFLSPAVKVEAFAFRNCIYLEEVELPGGETIKFEGITDRNRELPPLAKQAVLDRLNCFKTDEDGVLVECTGNISRLLVADGITAIGEHAFLDSNLLTEIILPRSVTAIGDSTFMNCKWLKTVRQSEPCGLRDGQQDNTHIGQQANSVNLTGIQTIGDMAFSGCGTLETIELSDALERIGIRAFEHCTSLREILLPEGVEEIPDRAFFRCHSLQYVKLPSTLKRIGKEAFAFCKQLSISPIPEGVIVEERAFVGCNMKSSEI